MIDKKRIRLILVCLAAVTLRPPQDIEAAMQICEECHTRELYGWYHGQHFKNRLGIVATCDNCHESVPDNQEVDAWEKPHGKLADSEKTCQGCHADVTNPAMSPAAQKAHNTLKDRVSNSCFDCHPKNIMLRDAKSEDKLNQPRLFARAEVARHASFNDYYIIYDETVYDVSSFRMFHSGGSWMFIPGDDNSAVCALCHDLSLANKLQMHAVGFLARGTRPNAGITCASQDMNSSVTASPRTKLIDDIGLLRSPATKRHIIQGTTNPPSTFVLDMAIDRGNYIDVFINGNLTSPVRLPIEPGTRQSYTGIFQPEKISQLRLDPSDAENTIIAVHRISLNFHNKRICDFRPHEIAQWTSAGLRQIALSEDMITFKSTTSDPVLLMPSDAAYACQPLDADDQPEDYQEKKAVQ